MDGLVLSLVIITWSIQKRRLLLLYDFYFSIKCQHEMICVKSQGVLSAFCVSTCMYVYVWEECMHTSVYTCKSQRKTKDVYTYLLFLILLRRGLPLSLELATFWLGWVCKPEQFSLCPLFPPALMLQVHVATLGCFCQCWHLTPTCTASALTRWTFSLCPRDIDFSGTKLFY